MAFLCGFFTRVAKPPTWLLWAPKNAKGGAATLGPCTGMTSSMFCWLKQVTSLAQISGMTSMHDHDYREMRFIEVTSAADYQKPPSSASVGSFVRWGWTIQDGFLTHTSGSPAGLAGAAGDWPGGICLSTWLLHGTILGFLTDL